MLFQNDCTAQSIVQIKQFWPDDSAGIIAKGSQKLLELGV